MLPKMTEPAQYLQDLDASPRDLVASVKAQGLEGLVAKHRDSRYEPGLRSGRVAENAGQSGAKSSSLAGIRWGKRRSTL